MVSLESMSKDERSLMLYLETRAVDHGGRVDTRHMNKEDFDIVKRWNDQKFIGFGRIVSRFITNQGSHWVKFTEVAWKIAHQERLARSVRMWEKRKWIGTQESIDVNGILAVRLGLVGK